MCTVLAPVLGFGSAMAAEGSRAESCRRGEDVRVIEVLTPGTVGTACDVRVTRGGGADVKTPYHANADRNFCRAMAAELASELTLEGFECSTAASGAVEAALAGGDAPADPIGEKLTELSLDQQAEQLGVAGAAAEPPAAAPVASPALAMAPIADAPPAPEPNAESVVAAKAAPSLEGIIEPDEPAAAPHILTAGAQPALERAPRPVKNGAGRIVGAQPTLEDIIDVSVDAPQPAAAPQLASVGALPSRATRTIIEGVMAANAAAWNEGNLPAFLAGYQNSGDVRLVADGAVAAGFSNVRRHYETLVASTGAMGRLSYSNLDVTMTAADIATVVGRYAHESGTARSAGAMTVVLKQIDGRWRIVQDTRIRDADVPTLAPVN
jgi:ketosteroid isomerase-like protein